MLNEIARFCRRLRPGLALIGALFAAAPLAHAQDAVPTTTEAGRSAGWSVTRSAENGPVMSRNLAGVTSHLSLVGDEYNMFTPALELTIAECAGKRWSVTDSISPVGANVAERAARVRELMVQQFAKARQACPGQAGRETELLGGMEAAYASFEAIRQ